MIQFRRNYSARSAQSLCDWFGQPEVAGSKPAKGKIFDNNIMPRAVNIPISQIGLYRSNAGTHWAILRSGPNSYTFTSHGYVHPGNAINRLIYNMNTGNVVKTNGANIQRWMNGIRLTTLVARDHIRPNALERWQGANLMHNIASGRSRLGKLARAATI